MQIIVDHNDTPEHLLMVSDLLQRLAGRNAETQPPAIVPVAAPEPTAPAAPAVPVTVAPPPSGDFDSEGLPWDARIHGANRARNADGSWRRRRNLDDAVWESVNAELRARRDAATPPAIVAAPVPPAPTEPVEQQLELPALDPVTAFAPQAPAAPAAPVAPAPLAAPVAPVTTVSAPPYASSADAPTTFLAFMPRITAALGSKRLTTGDLNAALTRVGVNGLAALQPAMTADPTLLGRLWADLTVVCGGSL